MKKPLQPQYKVKHNDGEVALIRASSPGEARRLAMIKRYGERPDNVTPHAPQYGGHGLDCELIK